MVLHWWAQLDRAALEQRLVFVKWQTGDFSVEVALTEKCFSVFSKNNGASKFPSKTEKST